MHSADITSLTPTVEKLSAEVGFAIRQRDWVMAMQGADRMLGLAPHHPDSHLRAMQAFLQAGAVDRAAQVARDSRAEWPSNPRLAQLAMLALGRSGDRSAAADAGRQALQGDPQDLRLVATVADALTQAGRPSEAVRALLVAKVNASGDARAWYELARARHAGGAPAAEVLTDARRALELDPANLRAIELVARLSLDLGMAHQTLALLEPLPETHRNLTILLLLVEACLAAGRTQEGVTLALGMAQFTAHSLPVARRLTALLSAANHRDAASVIYRGSLEHRRTGLAKTFAQGMSQILSQERPTGPPIPAQRIDWLWSQLTAAGRAPADRLSWERQLQQVNALDRLILEWIECRPKALADCTGFIDGIDLALGNIAAAQAQGRGVFLAAAHVGLLFGSLAVLANSQLPMAFVASVPNLGLAAHDVHLISTSGQDDGQIGRALYRAIKAGKVVSVAIEGGGVSTGVRHPLFDRMISVSTFIPRLAWKTRSPSFFPLVTWNGDRARATVTRLPDPDRYRSVDAYETAWTRAYLKSLETALLDHPESARAAGGFWGGISL